MKNGIETIEAKSGLGALRLRMSVYLPLATTDLRSLRNAAAGEFIFALVARAKASLKFAAVTASPLLRRSPLRIVKVYLRPPAPTRGYAAAASGNSDAFFSCQVRSLRPVANST